MGFKSMRMPSAFPCTNSLTGCDCLNFPIDNTSVESPDVPVEFCTVTVAARTGTSFASPCTRDCENPNPDNPLECVLESDNFLCAESSAQDCQNHDPDPPNRYTNTFFNTEQTCVVECPDGSTFSWTVPHNLIASAWQNDANAKAYGLACKRAKLHRICFNTDSPLTPCCVGTFSSIIIGAQGGTTPYTFAVTSGTIPPGMTFDAVGLLEGTPTLSGTYVFVVTVTDDIASTQSKSFTLRVVDITTTSPLPSGTTGTPYSQAIAASGTSGTVVWSLVSSTLPDGLTLSSAGVISGTPTAAQSRAFTVELLDGGGASCQKEFSLEIISVVALEAYWAFEAKSGGGNNEIADLTGNAHPLQGVAGLPTIVPGVVANGLDNAAFILDVTGTLIGHPLSDGISVAGWFNLNGGTSDGRIFSIDYFGGSNFVISLTYGTGTVFLERGFVAISATTAVNTGQWYFYRAWYDPVADTFSLQIDNGPILTSAVQSLVGTSQINTFKFFPDNVDSLIDETGWWQRVLSTTEVTNLYNSGNGITFGNPLMPP